MTHKPRTIEIAIFSIVILKVFITGIITTVSSFCEFYEYQQPELAEKINESSVYRNSFFTYTGFDTGYGFFAPNVSSNFIIFSENSDKVYNSSDLLQTSEGKTRFMGANDVFFNNFGNKKNEDKMAANKIILKRINKMFEKKYNSKFTTTVYLYEYPKLGELNTKKEHLIKIDEIK
ncbi:hypothetical protein [Chryseobacterium daecheongense]|uniref:Uncharacterized protein n=1 Tax=Chryseobacterium daecheongense TaxID=192389 RepID=A0A3N0VWQ5_9FLAO|nr:hypothetical protein [Chryseobacterium daecheongense]ROH96318.1 hypothetical protein EGI05_17635 [Chryseobacterium daecheongense]TDX89854.1 hypothetical protein BCF50_3569 [Chryseobacterium daecheongense]